MKIITIIKTVLIALPILPLVSFAACPTLSDNITSSEYIESAIKEFNNKNHIADTCDKNDETTEKMSNVLDTDDLTKWGVSMEKHKTLTVNYSAKF